jgi:chitodextrinase
MALSPVIVARRRLRRGAGFTLALTALAFAFAMAPDAHGATAVTWCGQDDVTTNRPDIIGTHLVHVLYAVPTGGSNQFTSVVGPIASDLAAIDTWWRGQDPTRTIRFDLYPFANCEPGFGQLDVTSIVLPKNGTSYAANTYQSVSSDLRSLGFSDETKKYLVYYDGSMSSDDICGQGGGQFALVYLDNCTSDLGAAGEKAETAAHELVHTFGAVDGAAPNECEAPHQHHVCDSSSDLMFWAATIQNLSQMVLDIGRDDYYGHSGNWLDIQDSVWLLQEGVPQVELRTVVEGDGRVASDPAGITDCRSSCSYVYNAGTAVTLRASPDSGKRFRGWKEACSGTTPSCTVQLAGAQTARAVFGLPNQRPTAAFDAKASYTVSRRIEFVSTSSDSDGSIQKTEWDFGDGAVASGDRVTHAYARTGFVRIHLTVTDDEGATTSLDRFARITDERPTAIARDRTARRGARVKLSYRVKDDVRVARVQIDIHVGLRAVTFKRAVGARSSARSVTWRAPKRPGYYPWCVQAWDARGQASARNCAKIQVL